MPVTELASSASASAAVVRSRCDLEPRVGILSGADLSGFAEEMEVAEVVPYQDVPGFLPPTAETRSGRLLLGRLGDTPVVAMQGRVHRYEGHSLQHVTFPVRVLRLLGVETLVVASASTSINPLWKAGELVLLDDHINLLGDSPLVGPNDDELGPRFPDMSEPYDRGLQRLAMDAAVELGVRLHRGVYVAVPGPALETRAEYRMLRSLGADVVGMSMVPEVIVARHMGVRVLGLSVIEVASRTEPDLTRLVVRVVTRL